MVETSTASTSSGAGAYPKEAMSDAGSRSGTVMACKCYRKAPYKTARGFREHLVLKHGMVPLEAEVRANLTYHEINHGTNQPQTVSNKEPTTAAAGIHELMKDGGQSQQFDWDSLLANQGPYQLQITLDEESTLDRAGGYEFESDESQTGSFSF